MCRLPLDPHKGFSLQVPALYLPHSHVRLCPTMSQLVQQRFMCSPSAPRPRLRLWSRPRPHATCGTCASIHGARFGSTTRLRSGHARPCCGLPRHARPSTRLPATCAGVTTSAAARPSGPAAGTCRQVGRSGARHHAHLLVLGPPDCYIDCTACWQLSTGHWQSVSRAAAQGCRCCPSSDQLALNDNAREDRLLDSSSLPCRAAVPCPRPSVVHLPTRAGVLLWRKNMLLC